LLDTQQLTTTFSQAAADRQTFYIAIKVTDQLLKLQHNTGSQCQKYSNKVTPRDWHTEKIPQLRRPQ